MARVYIGMGSNVGDRCQTLSRAWQLISKRVGAIEATSSLYDTAPALVTEQPRFMNGVVAARTVLEPASVLRELKAIEAELGRVRRERYGPREADLDLLFYGDVATETETLTLPHPRAREREFVSFWTAREHSIIKQVLVPLAETVRRLGGASESVAVDAAVADVACTSSPTCVRLVAGLESLGAGRTFVMGVLNATPDSFSDGGRGDLVERADRMVADGADVVDVGGESTRPGATPVDVDEEIRRVLPVVEAIKTRHPRLPVSVDTRRARVAKLAVEAGAGIVNDVSAGLHDPEMLATVAALPVAYIAMHMRGDPTTMERLAFYDDVVDDVSTNLDEFLGRAARAGIAPWRLVLDPGIGFAKTHDHNLILLRHLADLRKRLHDFPFLVGPSRKRFVGHLLAEPVSDRRDWGTAGACCACVPTADIVRVHHVRGIKQALAVADAIRR
ncbi:hypothetical protein CTAYLR_009854 [Chrysophaeum taylorii]|uniref:Pterin-binding domain-containing protein n=1 Tax=Chrysophaeum taylorii TaxID=2483200 RepID=A0AAD7U6C9_9STRA|nr:hypothetical protein CTAYLR_009854 [Chrysophaeum taylorii]